MMTMERPETTEAGAPRCYMGSRTNDPCWREATERTIEDRPEPNVCPEHYRSIQLGRKLDGYTDALYRLRAWIVKEVDSEYENRLTNHAYTMREKLEEEYWHAAVEDRAAELIANAGPSEAERMSEEGARRFAEVALRTYALETARGLLEDAPEDLFGHTDRWQIVAGLAVAAHMAHEEHERRKREMRL